MTGCTDGTEDDWFELGGGSFILGGSSLNMLASRIMSKSDLVEDWGAGAPNMGAGGGAPKVLDDEGGGGGAPKMLDNGGGAPNIVGGGVVM